MEVMREQINTRERLKNEEFMRSKKEALDKIMKSRYGFCHILSFTIVYFYRSFKDNSEMENINELKKFSSNIRYLSNGNMNLISDVNPFETKPESTIKLESNNQKVVLEDNRESEIEDIYEDDFEEITEVCQIYNNLTF